MTQPPGSNGSTHGGTVPHAVIVTMTDVEAKPVEWYWWPYIAIGTICMLDGDPGIGKSLLMTQLAASSSIGDPLPDQQGVPTLPTGEAHSTLLLSTEDSLAHTLKPRLEAAGADCSKIHVITGWIDEQGQERAFTLQHLPILEAAIQRYQPRLVVIDPITAYMGKVDIHRANEVQELLSQLTRLAEKYRCAIVCIRHPAKPGQSIGKVIHRGLGSVGFIGTARTALFVEQHPTNAAKVLLGQSKNNMAGLGRTQLFSKTDGHFEWCGVSRLSAEVIGGSGRGPDPTAFLEAVFWLEEKLKAGIPQSSDHDTRRGR
jgi:archaellum biogenesis ATPase FlaH